MILNHDELMEAVTMLSRPVAEAQLVAATHMTADEVRSRAGYQPFNDSPPLETIVVFKQQIDGECIYSLHDEDGEMPVGPNLQHLAEALEQYGVGPAPLPEEEGWPEGWEALDTGEVFALERQLRYLRQEQEERRRRAAAPQLYGGPLSISTVADAMASLQKKLLLDAMALSPMPPIVLTKEQAERLQLTGFIA